MTQCKRKDCTGEVTEAWIHDNKVQHCSKCGIIKDEAEVELTDRYESLRKCYSCKSLGVIEVCLSCIHNYREHGKN